MTVSAMKAAAPFRDQDLLQSGDAGNLAGAGIEADIVHRAVGERRLKVWRWRVRCARMSQWRRSRRIVQGIVEKLSLRPPLIERAVASFSGSNRQKILKRRLSSRACAPVSPRMCLLSVVQRPCLKLPFRAPRGPPDPFAPCRHGEPVPRSGTAAGCFGHICEPALNVGLTYGVVCHFWPSLVAWSSPAALTIPTTPWAPEWRWTC